MGPESRHIVLRATGSCFGDSVPNSAVVAANRHEQPSLDPPERGLDPRKSRIHLGAQMAKLAQDRVGRRLKAATGEHQEIIDVNPKGSGESVDDLVAGRPLLPVLNAGKVASAHRDALG